MEWTVADIVAILIAVIALISQIIPALTLRGKTDAETLGLSQEAWNSSIEAQAKMQAQINELRANMRRLNRKFDLALRTIRGLVIQVEELGGEAIVPPDLMEDMQ